MKLKYKKKLTFTLMSTMLVAIIATTMIWALPLYQGKSHYKGKDGNWYWCEHFTDSETGHEYTKYWVNNVGPHIGGGHIEPNKLVLVDKDTLSLPADNGIDVIFTASPESIQIKADSDFVIDIVDITTAGVIAGDINVIGNGEYQTVAIPAGIDVTKTYGLIAKRNGAPFYGRAFRFDGYEIVP